MDIAKAVELIRSLRKDTTSTGLTTGSNLNYINLEAQAKRIVPLLFPLLATIPTTYPMQRGVRVGGTNVQWKAIVGLKSGGYPALSEGNRGTATVFTERDYSSTYKYQGQDSTVTWASQFTGAAFDDMYALSQWGTHVQAMNDYEKMALFGNSGSGGNGFQLGACGTVTIAGPNAGGSVPNGDTIYVCCIALTGWGVTMSQTNLVNAVGSPQLPFTRTTLNGAQDVINGGTSAYSAIAGPSTASNSGSSLQSFTATVTAIKGAMGYAWYVGTVNSYGSLYLYSVTSAPTVNITSLPSSSNQAANATSMGGSGTFADDNSANALDFDGETTWAFGQGGYWRDLAGANLTANGDSSIAEFDTVQDTLWSSFKIPIQKIWLGGTLINAVTKKISSTGVTSGVTRLLFSSDKAGSLDGGVMATGYLAKYGPNAGKPIPIETHPWLPNGVIFFELVDNPYPQAAADIPAVRRIVTLEDWFSVLWPQTSLEQQYGIYRFSTMQHYIPFGMGVLTGVGNS